MPTGRFAPSPTGELHLGNLRTALLAWLFARSTGSRFLVRMEDLDAVTARPEHARRQLADLAALGLDWDGEVVLQSTRRPAHDEALAALEAAGLTYRCWCTRREIQEAAAAPHHTEPGPPGAYPGTCRELSRREQAARARSGRSPAVRLRSDGRTVAFTDRLAGPVAAPVDDVVLRRNDGTPAYNLAVVVDDAWQGVEEVVRGDDLLLSTPRQLHLADLLGYHRPDHAHVPLVVGRDGARLAKRHGAVTLRDLAARGIDPDGVRSRLAASLGLAEDGEPVTPVTLVERFAARGPERLPRAPWVLPAELARAAASRP